MESRRAASVLTNAQHGRLTRAVAQSYLVLRADLDTEPASAEEAAERMLQIRTTQLELSRAVSEPCDDVPPERANQDYVRLSQARRLVLALSGMDNPIGRGPAGVEALLLLGEYHNRLDSHIGMPAQDMPPLEMRAMWRATHFGFTLPAQTVYANGGNRVSKGIDLVAMTAGASGELAGMAQEVEHVAQLHIPRFCNSDRFATIEAPEGSRIERGRRLEIARSLPQVEYGRHEEAAPLEVQAFGEEGYARALALDADAPAAAQARLAASGNGRAGAPS